jgi:hypothetical protein
MWTERAELPDTEHENYFASYIKGRACVEQTIKTTETLVTLNFGIFTIEIHDSGTQPEIYES